MDEVLFTVIAENVGRYLDRADRLAGRQEELRRVVAAWRALLELHRPTGRRSRCSGCAKSRSMCTVWRVANAFFIRAEP